VQQNQSRTVTSPLIGNRKTVYLNVYHAS
jgi:hypothetical protein